MFLGSATIVSEEEEKAEFAEFNETAWVDPLDQHVNFYEKDPISEVIADPPAEPEPNLPIEEPDPIHEQQLHQPYRLKIGDKIELAVYGVPQAKRVVTINFSGEISFLYAKSLHVEGKTIEELRHTLQHVLSAYYREPTLIITPQFFSSEYYTVMGEVRDPGVKSFVGDPTVLCALCQAGGFTTRMFREQTIDQSDLDRSFLMRKGNYIPVDFRALLSEGDASQDAPLMPGDYIYIAPRQLAHVYVVGEVGSPSSIPFLDSITLTQAIAEAGGILRFASSRVVVIRGSLFCPERFLIDYNRIIKGLACDFPLESGDIVYAPAMQYTTLKEMVRAAVVSFVSIVATTAGTQAFIAIQPQAAVSGIIAPFPVLNNNAGIIGTSSVGIFSGSVNP
jgi:protein involved in polysaccharide export with SLBB domain